MKFVLFVLMLFLCSCACSDPRGCHPVDVGNTTDSRRLVREGRDEQTYMNTSMPMPTVDKPVSNGETVNPEVKRMDDIEIDDHLDLDKIKE